MSVSISNQEKSNCCQSISFDRYASNFMKHYINDTVGKYGEVVSDDPGDVIVRWRVGSGLTLTIIGQKNRMNDDYTLSNSQIHGEDSGMKKELVTGMKKESVNAMVKLEFNEIGGAHVYFEAAFHLSRNGAVKMFKQGWFRTPCGSHFGSKISKDIVVLGGVRDTKEFLNGFFLAVGKILLNHQNCYYSGLLSIRRKSSSRDCYSSLPMEIIARYDFHYDVSSDYYSGTSRKRSTEVFNKDVMLEILSRLPVKSLMRFKSVCKHWLYLIKQDQHLIDLHFHHSKSCPTLIYINPLQEKGIYRTSYDPGFDESKTLCQSISCAEIVKGSGSEDDVESIISKVRITDDKWFLYNKVLGPVNGLVCFVDTKTYAVRVYNASTRESTPWVGSTLLAEENDKLIKNEDNTIEIKTHHPPIYHFGFDPEKKEYKVFCFWRLSARPQGHRRHSLQRPDYARWEVLTLGRDTKWRKINMVPNENNKLIITEVLSPYDTGKQPVYADGTLYWRNKVYSAAQWSDPDVIVALDVGSEKFRVIPIPNYILHEPPLLFRMQSQVVKLWMLDDGVVNKLENCQGNESNWMPPLQKHAGIYADFVSLYSYDRREKSCKKIEIDGVSLFPLHSSRSLITSFTESLCSVT
ncbi:hypothetical protein MKW92_015054 [Papaver armeniacum]|nr:hypothetical protein MKW92_015054 [Papaver armeniacum]